MFVPVTTITLIFASFYGSVVAQTPRLLGKISAKHAGFLSLFQSDPTNPQLAQRFTLLASSFDGFPFSKDYVYGVQKIGTYLSNIASAPVQTLTTKVTWPNDVSGVPDSIFGPGHIAIPDGFLVPFKRNGSISILNITANPPQDPYRISDNGDKEWFYHKVEWKDVDNDGLMDALTCRMTGTESGNGQLVWFKNPGPPFFNAPWKANVIAAGPDTYLVPASLPSPDGNLDAILIPGYFFRRLSVYWIEKNGTWTNPNTVKSRVIEDNFETGAMFDVQYTDVNGDGRKDLLAISSNTHNGSVIVYELPDDFRAGVFKKHVIAHGFRPKIGGEGKTSPGSARTFRPSVTNSTSRPLILLSGDDSGKAYILTPTSTDPNNWQYEVRSFLEVLLGPIGKIALGDVDGDSYTELFVPEYDKGNINVFTFSPKEQSRIVVVGK